MILIIVIFVIIIIAIPPKAKTHHSSNMLYQDYPAENRFGIEYQYTNEKDLDEFYITYRGGGEYYVYWNGSELREGGATGSSVLQRPINLDDYFIGWSNTGIDDLPPTVIDDINSICRGE